MKWKYFFILAIIALLFYTRFVGLPWGLPFPFHPDERNMVDAILRMKCEISNFKECFNPEFWAYGQVPLFLGLSLAYVYKLLVGTLTLPLSYLEAGMGLRVLSAGASVMNCVIMFQIIQSILQDVSRSKFKDQKSKLKLRIQDFLEEVSSNMNPLVIFVVVIFSPYMIQFSHFGTTESLLMLLFSAITLFCMREVDIPSIEKRNWIILGLLCGFAIATKVSALAFVALPLFVLVVKIFKIRDIRKSIHILFRNLLPFVIATSLATVLLSLQSILHFEDFISSMKYESGVGTGLFRVFYTQQFENTIPVLFQSFKIVPFALGLDMFLAGIVGFFILSWRDDKMIVLRAAFLIAFFPSAFLYAKWTRFIAPAFPIMSIFAIILILKSYDIFLKKIQAWRSGTVYARIYKALFVYSIISIMLPGLAYLSIYTSQDIRYQASEWMERYIPDRAKVLQESGNAIDLPIFPEGRQTNVPLKNFDMVSYDFYTLDSDKNRQAEFPAILSSAEYVIVPSRRVWANYVCLRQDQKSKLIDQNLPQHIELLSGYAENRCQELEKKYPTIKSYYEQLLDENNFTLVAEFRSNPKISLFGKTLYEIKDESAEETWTVFDHPVIRVFQRKP